MEMIIGNTITLVTLVSKRILPMQAQLAKCYVEAERKIAEKGESKWNLCTNSYGTSVEIGRGCYMPSVLFLR